MDSDSLEAIVDHFKRYGEVLLFTELEEDETENIFREVLRKNKGREVTILINTNGGSMTSLHTILNLINHYQIKTTGVVIGKACSAGMFLLQYCDRRIGYPNTTYLVHFGEMIISNNLIYRLIFPEKFPKFSAVEELRAIYRPHLNKLIERSNLTMSEILQSMSLEVELTLEQALAYGLIDEIVSQPK